MAIQCKKLIDSLIKYKNSNKWGSISELSENSNVSRSILSKLINGKQEKIEIESWEKLHKFDPDFFPPPTLPEQKEKNQQKQFSKKAIKLYPFIEIIIDHANECAESKFDTEIYLKLCRNSIENELLKLKQNEKGYMKKTA